MVYVLLYWVFLCVLCVRLFGCWLFVLQSVCLCALGVRVGMFGCFFDPSSPVIFLLLLFISGYAKGWAPVGYHAQAYLKHSNEWYNLMICGDPKMPYKVWKEGTSVDEVRPYTTLSKALKSCCNGQRVSFGMAEFGLRRHNSSKRRNAIFYMLRQMILR